MTMDVANAIRQLRPERTCRPMRRGASRMQVLAHIKPRVCENQIHAINVFVNVNQFDHVIVLAKKLQRAYLS
jgi:hypothetical protein